MPTVSLPTDYSFIVFIVVLYVISYNFYSICRVLCNSSHVSILIPSMIHQYTVTLFQYSDGFQSSISAYFSSTTTFNIYVVDSAHEVAPPPRKTETIRSSPNTIMYAYIALHMLVSLLSVVYI